MTLRWHHGSCHRFPCFPQPPQYNKWSFSPCLPPQKCYWRTNTAFLRPSRWLVTRQPRFMKFTFHLIWLLKHSSHQLPQPSQRWLAWAYFSLLNHWPSLTIPCHLALWQYPAFLRSLSQTQSAVGWWCSYSRYFGRKWEMKKRFTFLWSNISVTQGLA